MLSSSSSNRIIDVYDMINYIRRYILKNDIPNFAYFPYFEYENLFYVIINGLKGGAIIKNDIIYLNNYKIFIMKTDNLYEIFIEYDDLIEPIGPL